jgi:hypothetical protein
MSEQDIFDLALASSAWRSMVAVRLGAGNVFPQRQRILQSACSEAFLRLQRHADLLSKKLWAAVHKELMIEKEWRNSISAEHFTISKSLLRTQKRFEEARSFCGLRSSFGAGPRESNATSLGLRRAGRAGRSSARQPPASKAETGSRGRTSL